MKRRPASPAQGELFAPRPAAESPAPPAEGVPRWNMPESEGETRAVLRVRWNRRLSTGQVGRVERELSRALAALEGLGFGSVRLDAVSVRRRRPPRP